MILAAGLIPMGYVLANAASFIEGKGLRLVGGVLDTGLLFGSTYALIRYEVPAYMEVTGFEAKSGAEATLGVAGVAGNYAALKYLIGSPTSTVANLLVGTLFVGPLTAISQAGRLKFH
jgi:hypothetical protein